MEHFYEIITSFPTSIWSFLLIFCILYWLVAVLGLIEFDFLDFDIPSNDIDVGTTDSLSNVSVLAGLMIKLGLQGVPFPFTFSSISLIGWLISYYACLFLDRIIPGGIFGFLIGSVIFFFTLYTAAFITGLVIKPLRPIFKAADQEVEKHIVGQVAIIRTARADKSFGEATVDDGGAGLIVKVRAYKDEEFKRGDRVVLLEYSPEEHNYKVIAENEFNN